MKWQEKPAYKIDYYKKLNALLKANVEGNRILVMGCHADNDAGQIMDKDIVIIEPFEPFFTNIGEDFKDLKNVGVVKMPWENITLKERFDCVVCCDCIEHSKEPYKILNRLVELSDRVIVTCPNGLFWFHDSQRYEDHGHGSHVSHFTRTELRRFFRQKGFKVKITGIVQPWLGYFSFGIFLKAVRA